MASQSSLPDESIVEHLLHSNEEWAARMRAKDPDFFTKLAEPQTPRVLWIGCSDSRVPESVITDSLPGAIFVHRNIANQVPLNDSNTMSVIEFSLSEVLRTIDHIVVVGHTGCGAVEAALNGPGPPSHLTQWLKPLVGLADSLDLLPPSPGAEAKLTEANVIEQVRNLANSGVTISPAGRRLKIHGWIFDLEQGLLRDLNVTTEIPK